MKKWKKIIKEKRAEGYIDTAVLVLCAMLVIAIAVRVYPVYITKLQLDNFADELIREMEIAGSVGAETSALATRSLICSSAPLKNSARPLS